MNLLRKLYVALIILFGCVVGIRAQTADTVYYEAVDGSSMHITGTSTIHDWEAEVKQFEVRLGLSSAVTQMEVPDKKHYKSVRVTVPVKEIKSGKSGMNDKIYGALEAKKHPRIRFVMTGVSSVSQATKDTTFTLGLQGELTIAGESKEVTISGITGRHSAKGAFHFSGSKSMKMSSFGVEPPSAMFGAIQAGDQITIKFDLTMKPVSSASDGAASASSQ